MKPSIHGLRRARVLLVLLLPTTACAVSTTADDSAAEPRNAAYVSANTGARCTGLVVRTRADVESARHCREIDGDLVFRATDFTQLTAGDFPQLRRITGSLLVNGTNALETIVLPSLVEVGTEGHASVVQFSFELTSLRSIRLPALATVHGDLAVGVLGALTELQLPKLARVDGMLGLIALQTLTTLDLPSTVEVGDQLKLDHLCRLAEAEVAALAAHTADRTELRAVGCCTQSAVACDTSGCGDCNGE